MPNASVTRMETAQLCTIPHRRGAGCHVCGDEETRSALTAACREPAPSVCPQRVRCAHATGWHQGPLLASRAQWWAARCPGRCCPLSAWGLGPTLSRWPRLGTMWSTAGQQAQQQGSFQKGWEWMACLPATAASGALPQGGQGPGWCVGNPLLGGGCSAHLVDTGELVALCACAVQRDGAGVWRLRGVGPVGLGHRRGLAGQGGSRGGEAADTRVRSCHTKREIRLGCWKCGTISHSSGSRRASHSLWGATRRLAVVCGHALRTLNKIQAEPQLLRPPGP